MAIYRGYRTKDGIRVTVDDEELTVWLDQLNLTLPGYDWGCMSPGAAQLSLAILAHHCQDNVQYALTHYRRFMELMIAPIVTDQWFMSDVTVESALKHIEDYG